MQNLDPVKQYRAKNVPNTNQQKAHHIFIKKSIKLISPKLWDFLISILLRNKLYIIFCFKILSCLLTMYNYKIDINSTSRLADIEVKCFFLHKIQFFFAISLELLCI